MLETKQTPPLTTNNNQEDGDKIDINSSSINDRDDQQSFKGAGLQLIPSKQKRNNFMSSEQEEDHPQLGQTDYEEDDQINNNLQENQNQNERLNMPYFEIKECRFNDRQLEKSYVEEKGQFIQDKQLEQGNQRYTSPVLKVLAIQHITDTEQSQRPIQEKNITLGRKQKFQSCLIGISSSIIIEPQVKEVQYNSYDNDQGYHCEQERKQRRHLVPPQATINQIRQFRQKQDNQETICTPSIRKVKSITQSQGNFILYENTHRSIVKNEKICQYCLEPLNNNKQSSHKKLKLKQGINSRKVAEAEKQDRGNLLTVSHLHIGNNKASPRIYKSVLNDNSLAEEDYDKINSIENSFRYLNPNTMTKSFRAEKSQFVNFKTKVQRSQTSKYGRYDSLGKRKWLVVQNLIKSIKFLNQATVRNLESPDDIIDEIANHQLKINKGCQLTMSYSSQNPLPNYRTQAIKEFRKENQFFSSIEKGGEKDLINIEKEILNDPRKHMRERTDPEHLINKKNQNGQTPLYVAALNGHLKVVEYLLQQGADPHLTVNVDKKINETILDVSIRWSHLQLVEYLLKNVTWSTSEVNSAYKVCLNGGNTTIKDMFRGYLVKTKQNSKMQCLCCFLWGKSKS